MLGRIVERCLRLAAAASLTVAFTIAGSPSTSSAGAVVRGSDGRIAFSRLGTSTDGCCDIYSINPDGTGVRRLTHGGTGNFPAWSPDGREIAYSPDARSSEAIWVMDADGAHARPVTHPGSGVDLRPAWSPDGKRIAFERETERAPYVSIWIVNADGTGATRLRQGGTEVAWAPSGKRIAFEGYGSLASDGIWVMSLDTGGLRNIVPGPMGSEHPSWSPDGKLIAFDRGRQDSATLGPAGIWVIHPNGTGLRRIARGRDWDPTWSPDGSRIAFAKGRSGFGKIWTIGAHGNGPREVTWLADAPDSHPDWQPLHR